MNSVSTEVWCQYSIAVWPTETLTLMQWIKSEIFHSSHRQLNACNSIILPHLWMSTKQFQRIEWVLRRHQTKKEKKEREKKRHSFLETMNPSLRFKTQRKMEGDDLAGHMHTRWGDGTGQSVSCFAHWNCYEKWRPQVGFALRFQLSIENFVLWD